MDKELLETIGLIIAGIVMALAVLRHQRRKAAAKNTVTPAKAS